jgi:hypothetical protein
MDAFDDRSQQPRATFEIAPEGPRARAGAQKLVQQVAVAGFDVDEMKTDCRAPRPPPRRSCRSDVPRSSSVQTMEYRQRDRCRTWRPTADDGRRSAAGGACLRPAESPEWVSCNPISRSSACCRNAPVRGEQFVQQGCRPCRVSGRAIVWLGLARPSGWTAAASPPQIIFAPLIPKFRQRRSVCSEGVPSRLRVPALHRMDAPAIADPKASDLQGLSHRAALGGRQDLRIDRQLQPQFVQPLAERLDCFHLSNLWIGIRHRFPSFYSG